MRVPPPRPAWVASRQVDPSPIHIESSPNTGRHLPKIGRTKSLVGLPMAKYDRTKLKTGRAEPKLNV